MTRDQILAISTEILESAPRVIIFKNRFATLCKRIGTVVNIFRDIDGTDTVTCQAFDFLNATLEDIRDYLIVLSTKNTVLANRVVIYGSDEEQFIKWNERLQHCIESVGASQLVVGVFNESIDLSDFEKDVTELRKSLGDIMQLVINGRNADKVTVDAMTRDTAHTIDVKQLMKTLEALVGHQTIVRSTYQTKTAPSAALEIDPEKIKYETVIGRGGRLFC
jgi:hypothetical protein